MAFRKKDFSSLRLESDLIGGSVCETKFGVVSEETSQ